VITTVVVMAVACVVVRWLLPLVLRLSQRPLQDLIDLTAALLVLPECLLSSTCRRVVGMPPRISYEYAAAIGWAAHIVHSVLGRAFPVVARIAGRIPAPVVAVVAGCVEAGRMIS
jgi:hypothetical protein